MHANLGSRWPSSPHHRYCGNSTAVSSILAKRLHHLILLVTVVTLSSAGLFLSPRLLSSSAMRAATSSAPSRIAMMGRGSPASYYQPLWRRGHSRDGSAFGPRRQASCKSEAEIQMITKETMKQLKSTAPADSPMSKMIDILDGFMEEYALSNIQANTPPAKYQEILGQSVKLMGQSLKSPHQFEILHRAIREPFDYYRWGVDFFRPLLEKESSKMYGLENLEKIVQYIKNGENVVLLSNHQTEVDPQAIEILLEDSGCDLASQLIFVAGHKVTTDPLAIPFSLGQNLLCIHSKKYIENPPELKGEKQKHNTKTMKKMQSLLEDGSTFLWVAPSGGRDRPDPISREFVVAPFDERSVQMFKLMAQKAESASGKKTHFFPMAMLTNELVPPPDGIKAGVGEKRSAKRGAACIWFGDEVDAQKGEGVSSKEAHARFYNDVVNQVNDKYHILAKARAEQLRGVSAN